MKINFSALFQAPLHKYTIFFIYGNEPTVFDRALSFLQKRLSLSLQVMSEEDILHSVVSPPSLFSADEVKALILIPQVTDKILKHLDSLKSGPYILTSDKARSKSKLVSHFSDSPTSLAISAYASPLLTSEFDFLVGEMNLPGSFKGLLFKAYQNDPMGLLATLEKIKMYGEVPEDQYDPFLENHSSCDDLSPVIHSFLTKDLKKARAAFSQVTPTDIIPLCRNLSRSFQTLFDLVPFQKNPKSIPWMTLSPPVFFKEQPLFEIALTRWKPNEIKDFLACLLDLEKQVKFSKIPFPHICQQLLNVCGL